MGIYDTFEEIDWDKVKTVVLLILGVIVIYFAWQFLGTLGQGLGEAIKGNVFAVSFEKNPIKVNEQTWFTVDVTNTTGEDQRNVVVDVKAKDEQSLLVNAENTNQIGVLGAGETRKLKFLINPVGEILPGKYILVTSTKFKIDDETEEFSHQAILEVIKK